MKLHLTNLYGMAGDSTVILAQNAVQNIASTLGFRELGVYFYPITADSNSEMNKRIDGIMSSVSIGDIVIFQSPTWNGVEFDRLFIDKLKDMQVKLVLFIHDVVPLMFDSNYYLMKDYLYLYQQADVLIVPSEKMKKRLLEEGLENPKILIQGMWDHPHSLALYKPIFKREIFFAGSLERFPGLLNWSHPIPLRVFSNQPIGKNQAPNFIVEGWKRDEELLLELSKGGFGLVWGTTENSGENRDYYGMNLSHKVSTYLAAGIPVIVPKNLSTMQFIVEQGLGFAVDTLEEASQLVSSITEEEYRDMTARIEMFSYLLKEGYFTKKILVEAIFQLGVR